MTPFQYSFKCIRTVLLAGFLLVIFSSQAQDNKVIDSLLRVLQTHQHDTVLVITRDNLSIEYIKANMFEKAKSYAEAALTASNNLGYERGMVRANHTLAVYYHYQRQFAEAFKHYETAFAIANQISYTSYAFRALVNMAHIQNSLGDQNRATDYYVQALEHAIKRENKDDMAYAHAFLGTSYLGAGDPQKALEHHQAALDLRMQEDDSPKKALAYSALSVTQGHLSDFPNAIRNISEAIRIMEPLGPSRDLSICYDRIGGLYGRTGDHLEAKKYFQLSLDMGTELNDREIIGFGLNNVGAMLQELGQFTQALEYYFRALRVHEEVRDIWGMEPALGNISNIYALQGNYPKALEFALKQLEIYHETGDKQYLPPILKGVGERYLELRQFEQADHYLLEALNVAEEIEDKNGLANIYLSIGHRYSLTSDHHQALHYFFKSLSLSEELHFSYGIARSIYEVGLEYDKTGHYADAKVCLLESLSGFDSMDLKQHVSNSYLTLYKLDSLLGHWETAFDYLGLYISHHDSLYLAENNRKLIQLEAQYNFDRKEDSLLFRQSLINEQLQIQALLANKQSQSLLLRNTELDLMQKERDLQHLALDKSSIELNAASVNSLRKQDQLAILTKESELQLQEIKSQRTMKYALMSSIVALMFLSFFGYSNYIGRQKLKLLKLRNKIAIDLHDDVGSTLSSISIFSEMARQQSKEVIPSLETIGESSRKMLDAMADIVWTIHPDNDNFEKILDRMRSFAYELLGGHKIDFVFDADTHLNDRKLPMDIRKNLYLIFKEATQNMVLYAEADQAHFSLKEENKRLTMVIRDNGNGINFDARSAGKSITLMTKRAEEIGGTLKIVSRRNEGTVVTLNVAV